MTESTHSRHFLDRFAAWCVRAILAGAFVGVLDAAVIAAFFPAAASSLSGFALTIVQLSTLYASLLIPAACALTVVDVAPLRRRLPATENVLAAVFIALPATVLVAVARHFLLPDDLEFRQEPALLLGLVWLATIAVAAFLAPRWLSFVASRIQRLPSVDRLLPVVSLGLASTLSLLVGHLACVPIHRLRCAVLTTLWAGLLAMLALRVALPAHGRTLHRATVAGFLLFAALGLYLPGPSRDHARFVVYVRGAASASLLPALRSVVDLDGDGSAPMWAGGTDCREGNAAVGPTVVEVPGDGIDQDCRGGDAPLGRSGLEATGPSGCQPPGERLSILLIVIDALRADFVSVETTPILSTFAESSYFFTRAYSPTGATVSSFPSLFSCRPLSDMGMRNPFMEDVFQVDRTLTERLSQAGYATFALGLLEFNRFVQRGFDKTQPRWMDRSIPNVKHDLTTIALSREVLDRLDRTDGPAFILLHLSDVHAPYVLDRSPSGERLGERAAYSQGVEYADFHLGQLFARMQRRGLMGRTIIAVTSDHGEELFERGRHGHGANVFEEGVRVPLILWIPGCPGGKRTDPVSTFRLGPTLGRVVGVDIPGGGLFTPSGLPLVSEGAVTHTNHFQRAIVVGDHKLIVDAANGGRMLFDLASDPGETRNLCVSDNEKCVEIETAYQQWLDAPGRR